MVWITYKYFIPFFVIKKKHYTIRLLKKHTVDIARCEIKIESIYQSKIGLPL